MPRVQCYGEVGWAMDGCPEHPLLLEHAKGQGLGLSCVLPAAWGHGDVSPGRAPLLPRGHCPIAVVLEGPSRSQARASLRARVPLLGLHG